MKIVHVCLNGPVTDGFLYQDNLLPKYHKKSGHNVTVITSKYVYNDSGIITLDERNTYENEYGIKTIRLPLKRGKNLFSKFKTFHLLDESLTSEKPDLLFVHSFQFCDYRRILKYKIKHPKTRLIVDNHADDYNSAKNILSKTFLHKFIWRNLVKKSLKYVDVFFGVTPSRVDFMNKLYHIPPSKTKLLVMGADDDLVNQILSQDTYDTERLKQGFTKTDFVLVFGGKIDSKKEAILELMASVNSLASSGNIKLVLFGSVSQDIKDKFSSLVSEQVVYLGWKNAIESMSLFAMADLVIFPTLHSVFWEQAVALKKPLLIRYIKGYEHLNHGHNVQYLYQCHQEEITTRLIEITTDTTQYQKMLRSAQSRLSRDFLYSNIAKTSLKI